MTEAEWMASADPKAMLEHLVKVVCQLGGTMQKRQVPLISDRKLRLFACACIDSKGRLRPDHYLWAEDDVERHNDLRERGDRKMSALDWAMQWAGLDKQERDDGKVAPQRAALLRDICGNPWRPVELSSGCEMCGGSGSVEHHSGNGVINCPNGYDDTTDKLYWLGCKKPELEEWLTYNNGTVRKIAEAIYQDRNFDAMPIIADALEDAGCQNEEILKHCRGEERCIEPGCKDGWIPSGRELFRGEGEFSTCCFVCNNPIMNVKTPGWMPLRGPHVRGCWVLDLLTGRE